MTSSIASAGCDSGAFRTGELMAGGQLPLMRQMAQANYLAIKSLMAEDRPRRDKDEHASFQNRIHRLTYERRINGFTEVQQTVKKKHPLENLNREFHRRNFLGFVPAAASVWADEKRKSRHFPKPRITDRCWESRGGKDKDGRPRYCPMGYTSIPMNKLAWWLDHPNLMPQDIPARLYHTCGNVGCVNPAHLSEKPRPRMGQDMIPTTDRRRENGEHNREKRFCPRGHALDGRNVYQQLVNGHVKRSCRQCRQNRNAQRQPIGLVEMSN